MPTPKTGYFLRDGTQVPGTTTICGAYRDAGGLLWWNWDQGRQGIPYGENLKKAGNIGTAAHAMVEAHLRGEPVPAAPFPEAGRAFEAFLRWEQQNQIKVLEQEMQLVSEDFRYGGTLDAVGIVDGEYVLLDWKTSKGVYKDHQLQLAAYVQLWNETQPGREIVGGAYLVRFSKTDATCEAYFWEAEELAEPFQQFCDMRRMWDRDFEFGPDLKPKAGRLGQQLERIKACMKLL